MVSRWLLGLFFGAVAQCGWCADVQPRFREVSVKTVIELIYGSTLHKAYVIGPDVLSKDMKMTADLSGIQESDLPSALDRYLQVYGVYRRDVGGVSAFSLHPPDADRTGGVVALPVLPPLPGAPLPVGGGGGQGSGLGIAKRPVGLKLYRPVNRPVAELQKLVNSIAGVSYSDPQFVLVTGDDEEEAAHLMDVVKRVDTLAGEVLVRALMVEFSSNSDDGVGLSGALRVLGGKLGISVGVLSTFENVASIKTVPFQVLASIIGTDSHFKVVATPLLRVRDGQVGKFEVVDQEPVLSGFTTDVDGKPVQNVSYQDAGVVFNVTPTVFSDRAQLVVDQQLSSFQNTVHSSINSPTISRRSLATSLTLEYGEVAVIGGLNRESSGVSRDSLFGLVTLSRERTSANSVLLLMLQVQKVGATGGVPPG